MEKKLLDESEEVQKLFESFAANTQWPLIVSLSHPPSKWKPGQRMESWTGALLAHLRVRISRKWRDTGTITGLATVQIMIAIFLKRIWLIISRSALTLWLKSVTRSSVTSPVLTSGCWRGIWRRFTVSFIRVKNVARVSVPLRSYRATWKATATTHAMFKQSEFAHGTWVKVNRTA